jgi:methyl-accepting chemotaxis protein
MNEQRRKALRQIEDTLMKQVLPAVQNLHDLLDQLAIDANDIRDAEQEALDGLPENMADSERANAMQDAVSALDELVDGLTDMEDSMLHAADHVEQLIQRSDEAKGD